jgi:hypothetical protein
MCFVFITHTHTLTHLLLLQSTVTLLVGLSFGTELCTIIIIQRYSPLLTLLIQYLNVIIWTGVLIITEYTHNTSSSSVCDNCSQNRIKHHKWILIDGCVLLIAMIFANRAFTLISLMYRSVCAFSSCFISIIVMSSLTSSSSVHRQSKHVSIRTSADDGMLLGAGS